MTWHAVWAVIWGATWGNNTAALEWAVAMGVAGWLARDHIGAKLAAWWAKHHGPHAVAQHRQALEEHEAKRNEAA